MVPQDRAVEGVGKFLARRAVRDEAQDLALVGGDVGEATQRVVDRHPIRAEGRAALPRRQHHGHPRQAGLEEGRRRTERKSLDVEVSRSMETRDIGLAAEGPQPAAGRPRHAIPAGVRNSPTPRMTRSSRAASSRPQVSVKSSCGVGRYL